MGRETFWGLTASGVFSDGKFKKKNLTAVINHPAPLKSVCGETAQRHPPPRRNCSEIRVKCVKMAFKYFTSQSDSASLECTETSHIQWL